MKVEIELKDIEFLKKEISTAENRIKQLESELKSLDAENLKKQSVELSKVLFDNYMECVFKHIGFTDNGKWQRDSVIFKDDLEHWLGKSWWDSERLDINIGAQISERWRSAFINLGIKPEVK